MISNNLHKISEDGRLFYGVRSNEPESWHCRTQTDPVARKNRRVYAKATSDHRRQAERTFALRRRLNQLLRIA